jgi:hypothetical protein
MVNEHMHEVTVSRDVVEKFYPLLADLILEVSSATAKPHAVRLTAHLFQAQLRDSDDEAEEVGTLLYAVLPVEQYSTYGVRRLPRLLLMKSSCG